MEPFDKHKFKISDKELDDPQAKIDLLKLTGKNAYIKTLKQFAEQRLPVENPGGLNEDQLKKLSSAEYEQYREKIHADLNKMADPKKPVFATVEISENQLASAEAKSLFVNRFGYSRFMQAMGLSGLEELDARAYHQVLNRPFKPYKTSSGSGGSNAKGDLDK